MIVALWGEYTKSWQWRWCWWNLHKLINGWHRVPIVDTWWRLRSVKVADAWNPPLVMMMLEEEQEEEEEEEMNSLLNLLASSFPSTNSFHSSRLASAVPANPVKMSLVPACRLFEPHWMLFHFVLHLVTARSCRSRRLGSDWPARGSSTTSKVELLLFLKLCFSNSFGLQLRLGQIISHWFCSQIEFK